MSVPGNVGSEKRGTKLLTEGDEGAGHTKQPHGNPIGIPEEVEHHKKSTFGGSAHTFPAHKGESHTFRGTNKSGALRMSGHSGAHRLGCKK